MLECVQVVNAVVLQEGELSSKDDAGEYRLDLQSRLLLSAEEGVQSARRRIANEDELEYGPACTSFQPFPLGVFQTGFSVVLRKREVIWLGPPSVNFDQTFTASALFQAEVRTERRSKFSRGIGVITWLGPECRSSSDPVSGRKVVGFAESMGHFHHVGVL